MWHEARKQERMIRGMIVDYRRRAERRKDFYEKIKAEPTQFMQLHGRQCKIHLDPAIAAAGDSPAIMMPWQSDSKTLIDRFDVRAHLDYIPEVNIPELGPEDLSQEERQCNYERYRILAQNVFLGVGEDKFLQQLAIEEQFGVTIEEKEAQRERLHEKKGSGAAIGYNYSDPSAQPSCSTGPEISKPEVEEESDDDSDFEIIDVDLSIDVSKMEALQAHGLNAVGPQFGMAGCDLFSFLTGDADDAEHQKQLLRDEKEKAMYSGRKSRRERRAHRDKKLSSRVLSPPSYAAAPTEPVREPSRSPSRSPSPAPPDRIQFITSFGADDEPPPTVATASHLPMGKTLYVDKLKQNLKRPETYSEVARGTRQMPRSPVYEDRGGYRSQYVREVSRTRRSRSASRRSRSASRRRRSWSRHSRSRSESRGRSRTKSRSYSPRRRRTRSRSRSRPRAYRNRSTSRSPTNYGSSYARHNRSRSMSYDSNDKASGSGVGTAVGAPIPRYYGRKKDDKQSSSELELDSESSDDQTHNKPSVGVKSNANQNQLRLTGSSSKGSSRETLSLKERLKRKMQAQLSRQLRADKRAEAERLERESRRLARRDEEMRELAIKLRRKQREMRHQRNLRSSDDSDRSGSPSSSRGSQERDNATDKNRSKSNSPARTNCPVWELRDDLAPCDTYFAAKSEDYGQMAQDHLKIKPNDTERYRDPYNRTYSEPHRQEYNPNYPPKYNRDDDRSYRDQERKAYMDNRRHDYQTGYYDNREQDGRNYYPPRRPFPFRGGFRDDRRYAGPSSEQYEGPSNWQPERMESKDDRARRQDRDASGSNARGKVKLVDY